jgi:hypothetical protein
MRVYVLAMAAVLFFVQADGSVSPGEDDHKRHITFYNTYAYLDAEEEEWVIPARVWVHKQRRWLQGITSWTVRIMGEYNPEQMQIFRSRMTDLLADSKWRRTVSVRLEGDPNDNVYRIQNINREYPRTDRNG